MPKRSLDWDPDDDRPRRRSRRDDDDDDDEEEEGRPRKPTRRKRRRPPPKSGFPVGVVLLVGGGVVLLIAGVVTLLPFMNRGGGVPGPNANGVVNNNPLGLPGVGPPAVVRPPLPPGWVDFKHPDCNLSIYCPSQMLRNEFYSPQPFGSPIPPGQRFSKGFHSLPTNPSCDVLASEDRPEFSPQARELRLKQTVEFGQNPTAGRTVTLGGKPAWEVSGELAYPPGTRTVSRRLWVGNRFYMCDLTGKDGHPNEAEVAAFFDSFVLNE